MTDERLIQLETRQAFQEDAVATLDDVVTRQQRQIDELSRLVAILAERLERLAGNSDAAGSAHEPPPHY